MENEILKGVYPRYIWYIMKEDDGFLALKMASRPCEDPQSVGSLIRDVRKKVGDNLICVQGSTMFENLLGRGF